MNRRRQITPKSNLNVAKLPRDVAVTMFVQFYRSKVGESFVFFFTARKSFCLFVSLISRCLPHLQFWIIILEKMPEWHGESDKLLSESPGKFVIICTLTLSLEGEGTQTAAAPFTLISNLDFFLIILYFLNKCKICSQSVSRWGSQWRWHRPIVALIFPYWLYMIQYSNRFSFQLCQIYLILVFGCRFQYLTRGKHFQNLSKYCKIITLSLPAFSLKVESFVRRGMGRVQSRS